MRPRRIDTTEQATAILLELITSLELARLAVNVIVPGVDEETLVKHQRQSEQLYFMRYGAALGALDMAHSCGKLADATYDNLRARALATLAEKTFSVR
jgi:hypothetical protein